MFPAMLSIMTDYNKAGASGMSLSDGTFNIAARDGFGDFETALDSTPDDVFAEDMQAGVPQQAGPQAEMMPGFLDVVFGQKFDRDIEVNPKQQDPAIRTAVNLNTAFTKAMGFQGETAKLQENKITSASGPGAKASGQYIDAKGAAVQDLKAAIADVRKQGIVAPDAKAPAAQDGGPGLAGVAASVAAGFIADRILPGAGTAMTVAAIGAGTFGAKNSGEFDSPAEDGAMSAYHSSAGHDTVDVMAGTDAAAPAAMNGAAFDQMMGQGPGFDEGTYEHIVKPGMDMKITFGGRELEAMEAMADRMDRDVQQGGAMFKRWLESDVDVTASIGDTPDTALKVKPEDEALLTSDNPSLRQEIAPPKISAMRLM